MVNEWNTSTERWWNNIGRGKPKGLEENCPTAAFCTTVLTRAPSRSNTGLRDETPAIDWLSHCTDYDVAEIIRNLVVAKLRYWPCDCSKEMGKAIITLSRLIIGVPAKLRSQNRAWTNFLRHRQLYQDWIISQIYKYNQPCHFKLHAGYRSFYNNFCSL